jgi:hypothetical protein
MVGFRGGQKKTARLQGAGGFSGFVGMRLAVPFRQWAREEEEKAVKPARHRIDLSRD